MKRSSDKLRRQGSEPAPFRHHRCAAAGIINPNLLDRVVVFSVVTPATPVTRLSMSVRPKSVRNDMVSHGLEGVHHPTQQVLPHTASLPFADGAPAERPAPMSVRYFCSNGAILTGQDPKFRMSPAQCDQQQRSCRVCVPKLPAADRRLCPHA